MRNLSVLALGASLLLMPALAANPKPSVDQGDKATESTVNGIETDRFPDGSVLQTDRTGKGAVLCLWGIYQAVRAVGAECHKGEDVEFQAELERSIKRTDDFIIANSKPAVTRAGLEAYRSKGLMDLHSHGNICTGDAEKLYSAFQRGGADSLKNQNLDMLSIPRQPVTNPCL